MGCLLYKIHSNNIFTFKLIDYQGEKTYTQVQFEGPVLSVIDLKRAIVQQKKLGIDKGEFDLQIQDDENGKGMLIYFKFTSLAHRDNIDHKQSLIIWQNLLTYVLSLIS